MTITYSDNIWKVLICPECSMPLGKTDTGIVCSSCFSVFSYSETGALDLRLRNTKNIQAEFTIGSQLLPENGFEFAPLLPNPEPEVDFSNIKPPHHLSQVLLSHFPKADNDSMLALDLGCGSTIHREVCEHAGFEYVGMDFGNPKAMMLGDAHSLPFKDNTFDFIISIAVLEHIQYPHIAMKEAYRVLKPNGCFIGTVAFLEPFHSNSIYHHTHLGTYNSLVYGGFKIEHISPDTEWSVLDACSKALFPKMPRWLQYTMVMPVKALHRLWWNALGMKGATYSENRRLTRLTGSITFVASKN